jgi:hypothetical protein
MAWHHRLIAAKYTAKRQSTTEQQKKMAIIRELWIKLAEENPDWVTADPIVHWKTLMRSHMDVMAVTDFSTAWDFLCVRPRFTLPQAFRKTLRHGGRVGTPQQNGRRCNAPPLTPSASSDPPKQYQACESPMPRPPNSPWRKIPSKVTLSTTTTNSIISVWTI